MNKDTGWEIEYRTHFNSIVQEYENSRPEWVESIFDDIAKYARPKQNQKAIEIGVGTGKATRPILNMGYNVTAIEINERMAAFSLERFKENKSFNVLVSSFEDAPLEENSYELIYAASAFHWVDAKIGLPKAIRLLKNTGTIALFRYNEIASPENDLYNEIRKIHNQYYDSYYNVPYKKPTRKLHEDFCNCEEIHRGFRFYDLKDYGFYDVTMKFYDVTLEYSADKYIELLNTLSDHRNLPDDIRVPFYSKIKQEIKNSGGFYKIDYTFQLYMGRK